MQRFAASVTRMVAGIPAHRQHSQLNNSETTTLVVAAVAQTLDGIKGQLASFSPYSANVRVSQGRHAWRVGHESSRSFTPFQTELTSNQSRYQTCRKTRMRRTQGLRWRYRRCLVVPCITQVGYSPRRAEL